MSFSALLLGSIGVIAETSDLQRHAFNAAFEKNGLGWTWDAETYRDLLEVPGGKARIRYYGLARGVEVDIETIYHDKVAAFEALLRDGVDLRPGILDLVRDAQAQGVKVGFVTSTDARQVDMILNAVRPALGRADFDFVGNRAMVEAGKPAPNIYFAALKALGLAAENAIAIEDTPESAQAAIAAGVRVCAYPGAVAKNRVFPVGVTVLDRPAPWLLMRRTAAA